MSTSKKSENDGPKRPTNAYFKFRADIWEEVKNQKDSNKIIKSRWDSLDPKAKEEYKTEFEAEMK